MKTGRIEARSGWQRAWLQQEAGSAGFVRRDFLSREGLTPRSPGKSSINRNCFAGAPSMCIAPALGPKVDR